MSDTSRGAQKRIAALNGEHPPEAAAPPLRERANGLWQQVNIRGLQVVLGAGFSVVFLWLAFRNVLFSQVAATFSRADYGFVGLALALVLVSPLVRAARWRLLYHPDQKGLSCLRLAEVLLISQMLNIVVPARLGEVARIYFMGQTESRSRARTLGTIAVEKWLDILMLLLLVLLVPIFVSLPPWFRDSRVTLAVFATAFLSVALTLSYGKDRLLTLVESASRFLPEGWRARIHRATGLALDSLDVLRSPWVGLRLQGWSLLIWMISILVNYIIFLALGLPLPFAAAPFLLVVLEIGVAVPSVPGKLGIFHYLCTLALGVFGLEKGAALGYAVLLYFVVFVPPSLLGAFFLWWEGVHRPLQSPPKRCPELVEGLGGLEEQVMNQRRLLISVVIPVHSASKGLGACLDALERQATLREKYEIVVVNDGPVDITAETIADRHGVTFLSQAQRGAAAARNLGAKQAQGDILLFTDADCIPESNWVEAMIAPFADQEIAGVCGVVRTRQTGLIPRFIQLEYDYRYRNIARHTRIDFVNTGTAGYRRHVFMDSGGFRENLLGAEDTELSFRLAGQGHKMVFAPGAIVYHSHPESILEYARRKHHYSYWRMIVYRRHPRKAVADSRTPQTQKIQIGLLFLLVATIIGSIFWKGLVWLAGGLALLFLLISLPFWWWALRKDLKVGSLTPLFLLVATASVGAGVMAGLTCEWLTARVEKVRRR